MMQGTRSPDIELLLVSAVTCSSSDAGDWTKTKAKTMEGAIKGATLTIELPSTMKPMPKDLVPAGTAAFAIYTGDRNLVANVKIEALSLEPSFERDSAGALQQGYTLMDEQPGASTYSFAYRKVGQPGASGRVYRAEAEMLVRCTWELPETRVKGSTFVEWPVLKRACESIKLTPSGRTEPA